MRDNADHSQAPGKLAEGECPAGDVCVVPDAAGQTIGDDDLLRRVGHLKQAPAYWSYADRREVVRVHVEYRER